MHDSLPHYWQDACNELAQKDKVMKKLIRKYEDAKFASRGDAFQTLARSIVGQQLSVKAAQTIWDRFALLSNKITPKEVLRIKHEALRQAGLSQRKCEYLNTLAVSFDDGTLTPSKWKDMTDAEITDQLITLRGIGRWTAQMFLIFHLMRPDVYPTDDIGLLRGIGKCYFDNDGVSSSQLEEIGLLWTPWRTVGTWYIWRDLDPVAVEY